MQVKYVGVFSDDGVELHDSLGAQWFNGHEATDVSAELAAALLAQPLNWAPADTEAEDLAHTLAELTKPPDTTPAPSGSEGPPVAPDTTPAPSGSEGPPVAPDTTAPTVEVAP